jgi:zinc transporter ZupT
VEVLREDSPEGDRIAEVGAGDVFGEMALLTGATRGAAVRARTAVKAVAFAKEDFDRLLEASPALKKAVAAVLARRVGQWTEKGMVDEEVAADWLDNARSHLGRTTIALSPLDLRKAHEAHGGAAMAIWLGILLDGIPESLVIGGTMGAGKGASLTLIAGVFLANFPEALSSAVGMRKQGSSPGRVLWMWASLMILTGVGAWIGYFTGAEMPPHIAAFIEATAAGAMLAMIAETMLPEATEQGGPATGLMTVLGFLAAILVSHLEQ